MSIGETIRTAFGALGASKIRAFLALLGIIIGVAAVIAVVGIGEGAKRAVQERIASWASSHLEVWPRWTGKSYGMLTPADADTLARRLPLAREIVPRFSRMSNIRLGEESISGNSVVGTTGAFARANHLDMIDGRFFTDGENDARRPVLVAGVRALHYLTKRTRLTGEYIWINGEPFQIIGVIDSTGGMESWNDVSRSFYVPLRTVEARFYAPDPGGQGQLVTIGILARDESRITEIAEDAERILRRQHKIPFGKPNDFSIENANNWAEAELGVAQTFASLILGVAAISLVIGGIGIMNIMYVTVAERTREIGLRKALGARRRTILAQFLAEAIILCTTGGVLGIGLAYGAAWYIGEKFAWMVIVRPDAVAMAFGCATLVGLVFGILPAIRAARLDPVEALRHE